MIRVELIIYRKSILIPEIQDKAPNAMVALHLLSTVIPVSLLLCCFFHPWNHAQTLKKTAGIFHRIELKVCGIRKQVSLLGQLASRIQDG